MAIKRIKIKKQGNEFLLVGAKTVLGLQVASPSLSLIQAIAEEWQHYGELDAVNHFGFYSAYSTYRDYIVDMNCITEEMALNFVTKDHCTGFSCGTPLCVWEGLDEDLKEIGQKFLDEFVFQNLEGEDLNNKVEEMHKFLLALKDYEVAAFVLLNGMFGVPISLALSFIFGRVTSDQITWQINLYYQIDDPTQQYNCDAVSVIDEFLRMMREADVSYKKVN